MADILKLVSERLPFFRSRALKVSLLVEDLRRLRWMEPVWRGREDANPGLDPGLDPGLIPVGVAGGDWGRLPDRSLSSSDSLRPRTLRLDLRREGNRQIGIFEMTHVGLRTTE